MKRDRAGNYNPTIKLCRAICRVLGKTLDDLLGGRRMRNDTLMRRQIVERGKLFRSGLYGNPLSRRIFRDGVLDTARGADRIYSTNIAPIMSA
jgi:hypothetical protein